MRCLAEGSASADWPVINQVVGQDDIWCCLVSVMSDVGPVAGVY